MEYYTQSVAANVPSYANVETAGSFSIEWGDKMLPKAMRMRYKTEFSSQEGVNRENGKDPLLQIRINVDRPTDVYVVGYLLHGTENAQHRNILCGNAVPTDAGVAFIKIKVIPQKPILEFSNNDLQIMAINKRTSSNVATKQGVQVKDDWQNEKLKALKVIDNVLGTQILKEYPFDETLRGGNQLRLGITVVRESDKKAHHLISDTIYYMKRCTCEITQLTDKKDRLTVYFHGPAIPRNATATPKLKIASKKDGCSVLFTHNNWKHEQPKQNMDFALDKKSLNWLQRVNMIDMEVSVQLEIDIQIERDCWTQAGSTYNVKSQNNEFKLQERKEIMEKDKSKIVFIDERSTVKLVDLREEAPKQKAVTQSHFDSTWMGSVDYYGANNVPRSEAQFAFPSITQPYQYNHPYHAPLPPMTCHESDNESITSYFSYDDTSALLGSGNVPCLNPDCPPPLSPDLQDIRDLMPPVGEDCIQALWSTVAEAQEMDRSENFARIFSQSIHMAP